MTPQRFLPHRASVSDDLRIPLHCQRCGRIFRNGERVRVILAGPAADSKVTSGFVIPAPAINRVVEHENIDHCTEGR